MKHLLTCMLATIVSVSIFATSQHTLRQLTPSAKETLTPAQQQAINHIQYDPTRRVARASQTTNKIAPAKLQLLNPIQRASAEAIILDGGSFLVEPEYEAETQEWYIAVESNGYTFRLCWYGSEEDFCGTYTIDDISMEYTWGWYQSSELFYEIYPTDITMTISQKTVSDCLQQLILDATITDTEDNIYELHIVHDTFTPKQVINHEIKDTKLTITDGQFTLAGNNDEIDLKLTVNSMTVEGEYTHDDFAKSKTKVTYNGTKQTFLKSNLLVIATYLEDNQPGYMVDFSFYNQDTILHIISMTASLPQPRDTIEVTCTNLVVDESLADYGIISVSGSSDLYDIFVMYEGSYAEPGVYKNISVMVSDMITWEMYSSINATLTLTEDPITGWHATIEAYCSDYNWYSIDMTYQIPEPTDTIQITFDQVAVATYDPWSDNMLQLLTYGEEYEASVTIFDVAPGDSFSIDNVYLDYSGLYDIHQSSSVAIADINGTLHQNGDTTIINASIIGFDAIQYDIQLWYAAPTPIDTVTLNMPVEFINDMDYGYYTLASYTPDSTWYVSLSPVTDKVAGTFINDGRFGMFGAPEGRYDFYGGNTFIYSEKELKTYTVEKGSLLVEVAADGTITAEAKVICTNSIYYHIQMTSEYNTHLDYDEPDVAVDRTYTTEDNVTIIDYTAEAGYIYLSLTAADDSDMAAFFFFAEEPDPEIIVPVGIYPIDSSEDYGTVYANPGVQGDGVWPSFYAQMYDGELAVPLWLLVSGSVEVSKDEAGNPRLEVNAFNSYGVPVHIVYEGSGTGVENIPADNHTTQKILIDGQFYILQQGKIYNTMGAQIQ